MNKRCLKPAQLKIELEKCLHCMAKPCMKACPVHCSPCDFIAAAKAGEWQKAAELIESQNPLAQSCGLICPDKFCQKACIRANLDKAIKIPAVQAAIMQKARKEKTTAPIAVQANGKKIAVIGSGPAGIGAAAELLKHGFTVTVFEKNSKIGGALNLIPDERLPREVIAADWQKFADNPHFEIKLNSTVNNYEDLLNRGFNGVIAAIGEQSSRTLNIEGEELCVLYIDYLSNPQKYAVSGNVAVVGGGEVALDCALTAKRLGGTVEMFVRRGLSNMRMGLDDYAELIDNEINVTTMTRVSKVVLSENTSLTAYTIKTRFNSAGKLEDIPNTETARPDFSLIILALGSSCKEEKLNNPLIVYAGDCINGGSTAVEAIASGKAAAQKLLEQIA